MSVNVNTRCFILSLFIRDDGERMLLGSGKYDFKDNQQHFVANSMVSDTVDVQGTDGTLLAGQVRRASTQPFDGYVGDATSTKAEVEEYRRDFIEFFAKNHFYTVVYVFSDGTAIKRQRGFVVDAPEVQELFQIQPEYHVALNFEDVNYYEYNEDEAGNEIYSQMFKIARTDSEQGGLVWDNYGAVMMGIDATQKTVSGTSIEINDALPMPPEDVKLYGDTEQVQYSGKNLFSTADATYYSRGQQETYTINGTNSLTVSGNGTWVRILVTISGLKPNTIYTVSSTISSVGGYSVGFNCSTGDNDSTVVRSFTTAPAARLYISPVTDSEGSMGVAFFANWTGTSRVCTTTFDDIQVEEGSTLSSYEPYVGGVASPNPDYPQPIETVTGLQTVTISDGGSSQRTVEVNLGKNLFNQGDVQWVRNNNSDYKSTVDTDTTRIRTQDLIKLVGGKTYTISGFPDGITLGRVKFYTDPSATNEYSYVQTPTFTVPTNATYVIFQFNGTNFTSETNTLMANADIQLEYGSTATSYSPYFDPIELCKIGSYQDYIYKDNGNWYLHKAVSKVTFDGSENWDMSGDVFRLRVYNMKGQGDQSAAAPLLSNRFVAVSYFDAYQAIVDYGIAARLAEASGVAIRNKDYTTLADFKTWLANNNVRVYYLLATPTDTQITNSEVLAGLNQLGGGSLYAGTNNILVASENLPGTLQLTYDTAGGDDPGGFEWEAGGGGAISSITVDSISEVYPLITITGPATNPTLENITTSTTMSYSGTVAAGQTLIIDTMAQTAKLSGTNVVQNLYGDWLFLAPGVNRIAYTTTNSDAPEAEGEFNEIVG